MEIEELIAFAEKVNSDVVILGEEIVTLDKDIGTPEAELKDARAVRASDTRTTRRSTRIMMIHRCAGSRCLSEGE
eukprot:966694-Heterocapsa_arctica.AAC.1